MTLTLPSTLTIQPKHLIYGWMFLHVAYAVATHAHWLRAASKYAREQCSPTAFNCERLQAKYNRRIARLSVLSITTKLICGLEAKMLELILFIPLCILSCRKPWDVKWHNTTKVDDPPNNSVGYYATTLSTLGLSGLALSTPFVVWLSQFGSGAADRHVRLFWNGIVHNISQLMNG